MIPNISASVLAKAKAVWDESIDKFGSDVVLSNADDTETLTIKAFAKRPKILGLFDRTHASYDQERYMLMIKAGDVPGGASPAKFMRATWDGEDHVFISVTKVELVGTVFGYRILVKG
jgi:hypothetical protein